MDDVMERGGKVAEDDGARGESAEGYRRMLKLSFIPDEDDKHDETGQKRDKRGSGRPAVLCAGPAECQADQGQR
jgi:hypothetical protein